MRRRPLFVIFIAVVLLVPPLVLGIMLAWPMTEPGADSRLEVSSLEQAPAARPAQTYVARDGEILPLRVYPVPDASAALILIHGITGYGDYFHPLASALAEAGAASVYVPDLRGHGENPARRGDIDHLLQLEEDFADLIAEVRERHPDARLYAGGHSAGGGLALRMVTTPAAQQIDGYVLLAPFLGPLSPTTRRNDHERPTVYPNVPRFIALMMLNRMGVQWFNHLEVVRFSIPESYRDGRETGTYTWRAFVGYVPRDHRAALAAVDAPLLLVSGLQDEAMEAQQYLPVMERHAPHAEVMLLPDNNHMDLISAPLTAAIIRQWLTDDARHKARHSKSGSDP